jgi:hypothetical protein
MHMKHVAPTKDITELREFDMDISAPAQAFGFSPAAISPLPEIEQLRGDTSPASPEQLRGGGNTPARSLDSSFRDSGSLRDSLGLESLDETSPPAFDERADPFLRRSLVDLDALELPPEAAETVSPAKVSRKRPRKRVDTGRLEQKKKPALEAGLARPEISVLPWARLLKAAAPEPDIPPPEEEGFQAPSPFGAPTPEPIPMEFESPGPAGVLDFVSPAQPSPLPNEEREKIAKAFAAPSVKRFGDLQLENRMAAARAFQSTLELAAAGRLVLQQDQCFGDITVKRGAVPL